MVYIAENLQKAINNIAWHLKCQHFQITKTACNIAQWRPDYNTSVVQAMQ